jgi:hypothetical protein
MPIVVIRSKGWTIDMVDDVREAAIEHGYEISDELEGVCLHSERMILIDGSLERAHRMEIVVHEVLHAYDPEMSEVRVRALSRVIARALWRMGYAPRR